MPCISKKGEIERKELGGCVDVVMTSREFAELIRTFGIDWKALPEGNFDTLLGESSGGGAIFGVTGGVMEASLRYAHEKLTNSKLDKIQYDRIRGFGPIRTSVVNLGEIQIKTAVCAGIASAGDLIASGKYKNYTFIEVMACPLGCITGGGQPKILGKAEASKRAESIFQIDQLAKKTNAEDNSEIQLLYSQYLSQPYSETAHKILHIDYS